MELSQWLSLLGICLLGAMSPGPSLAVVLKSTLHGGRSSGYSAAIAHGVGVALYGLLTITGLAALLAESPRVYLTFQLLGALYLVYLGLRSLRSSAQVNLSHNDTAQGRSAIQEGFLVAFHNPKLAVFMLALFSQFLQPHFEFREKAIMVATVGVTDACWYALVATFITQRNFLQKLKRNAKPIDRVFGIILIGLALSVMVNALAG